MADHQELLKSMLQDIINNREDQASVTMHDYFVSKTREVSGMSQPEQYAEQGQDVDDTDLGNDLGDNEDQNEDE